ncbi:HAD family hydrolase [Saliterribacillus persicus]|uniref:Cof subfamily protein (Haloacid dehalogenase superfamily)/HAD superfamily hydrolase (TIGR01484 family) n=1 Tax=Saliterribacillus persicus TaxID=930114 RepID=A0A368XV45_9BACI|nr:HAD family hydrolase [Saliterribacillus persicus]RCW71950.1 hypothetical protein DFR57_105134 [Saliterribacillus persicus]
MTNYKVLFLDIDGTILKRDHTIEDSTKEAIKAVQEKGIEVFLATGRPLHEVLDIADLLDIDSYIGYNGAYAEFRDDIIVNEPFSRDVIQHYLEVAKANNHEMVLYTDQLNLFTSMEHQSVKDFIDYFKLQQNKEFDKGYIEKILGITVMNVAEGEPELYRTPLKEITFSQVNVSGLEKAYDVIQDDVNKGMAVKLILDKLGIKASEAIAFGDGMNDKQMLQFAGESFAMGNANKELFAYAKHRTTSVEDSGVYNGLKRLGLI